MTTNPLCRERRAVGFALWMSWPLALACVLPVAGQTYSIRNLGAPPNTGSSWGLAVNNKDEVLADGVFGPYNGTPSIFLPVADYGMPAGLDYLPYSGYTNFTGLQDQLIVGGVPGDLTRLFNDLGQILGTINSSSHAAFWQNGHVTDLGTLGGSVSIPFALNQNGDIIGYSTTSPEDTTNLQPFMVLAGTTNMIPIPGLDSTMALLAFNNRRQIVAYSRVTATSFVWQNGSAQDANSFFGYPAFPTEGPVPDGSYDLAVALTLNDLGEVLGNLATFVFLNHVLLSTTNHSFIYSPAGGNGLGPGKNWDVLPPNAANPIAAWNTNGQFIYAVPNSPGFYFWDKGHSLPLQNLVPAAYAWTNLTPFGLNDRGDIVGQGTLNGLNQAFLLYAPDVALTVTASPASVAIGAPISVHVAATNQSGAALSSVALNLPIFVSGTGSAKPQSVPPPPASTTLQPQQGVAYDQSFIATGSGWVGFGVGASWVDSHGIAGSVGSLSPRVAVLQPLALSLSCIPQTLADIGDTIEVLATVTNTSDASDVLTQVQLTGQLSVSGSGGVQYQSGPLPDTGVTLSPGDAFTFTNVYLATNSGSVTFSGTATGVETGGQKDTVSASSEPVQIAGEIIVNSTGDLPNKDPNGCCCDTGNTLADGETPECTLRAAIELANRLAGKQIIQFQVPGDDPGIVAGVPSIRPATPLPDITNAVVIDGWSQASAASRPPVELSGIAITPRDSLGSLFDSSGAAHPENLVAANLGNGLHVLADGCEIRGLVLNSFPNCGILLDGPNTIVQGNYLGTDAFGAASAPSGLPVWYSGDEWEVRPPSWYDYDGTLVPVFIAPAGPRGGGGAQVCVRSPGNLIGGTGPLAGNVISGGPNHLSTGGDLPSSGALTVSWAGAPGLVLLGGAANGNVVEGNIIGLDASASHTPSIPLNGKPYGEAQGSGQYIGVWIIDGLGNRVGGSTTGAGNLIAGNLVGVGISGASASGNVVAGNQIGWGPAYTGTSQTQSAGVLAGGQQNLVGGSAGAGNIIGLTAVGISDGGTSNSLLGNWIGVLPDGKTAIPAGVGIYAVLAQSPQIARNTIANIGAAGIQLQQSPFTRVLGNSISACDQYGVEVSSSCPGTVLSLNTIIGCGRLAYNGGAGVYVPGGAAQAGAVTISQNSISASAGLGIAFTAAGKPYLTGQGVQPVRMLFRRPPPLWANGQLQITGIVDTALGEGGTYLLEFFSNDAANLSGYGEGQTFVGSAAINVGSLGNGAIQVTLPSPSDLTGQFLTATATDPTGSTTEFSPAALIQSCLPGIKGICPGIEMNVPGLPSSPGKGRPKGGPPTGDGNGDGIPDWEESNVASLPSLAGLWVTLSAPPGIVMENVTPTGPPDFASLPAGYVFPIGFLSFSMTNLPAGGGVTLTNFLHLDADPGFSYAATTYFNFGPTPDNATPHWYQFLFDGETGAELLPDQIVLHFQDGARGDSDLTVNGEIVTVGASAYALAPAPQLSLAIASVGSTNIVDIFPSTNIPPAVVTNPIPLVTSVLSWPAGATNSVLQFLEDLSPQDTLDGLPSPVWQTVPGTPVIIGGRNVLTNTTLGAAGFYRLFPTQ